MADFEDIVAASPAPAMNAAARGDVDQAAIGAVNEELNYPSLQKLRRVLDRRDIPYNRKKPRASGETPSGQPGAGAYV